MKHMDRRTLLLLIAAAFGLTGIAWGKDPTIRKVERGNEGVFLPNDCLACPLNYDGWRVVVSEDDSLDIIASNPGPLGAKFSLAKPENASWHRIQEWYVGPGETRKLVFRATPDNEDWFFWGRIQKQRDNAYDYDVLPNDENNSSSEVNADNNVLKLKWKKQTMSLTIQRTPGTNPRNVSKRKRN